jgi:hypothetical protein
MSLIVMAAAAVTQQTAVGENTAVTQAEKSHGEALKIPHARIRVKVLDPDGNPVEGAEVRPTGLRSRVEPGAHCRWVEKFHGPVQRVKTNAQGIAELSYPKFVTEKLETGQVTWLVDHEDHVLFYEDRSVDDELAQIKLKDGYRIATTAVNAETKAVIRTELYASVAGAWNSEWQVRKGGVLTSRVFDRTQAAMRVVHLPKDGTALFSDLIRVNPDEGQRRVFLRDVNLKQGTAVRGMLDKTVPRPVKNGYVNVEIVVPGLPHADSESWDGLGEAWEWSASTKVEADGSFRFDSLPTGDVAQMVAVCNGWVSKLPDDPDLKEKFPALVKRAPTPGIRWPQLFKLSGRVISPVLRMEQTATCEVTVLDPTGKPLPDAMVVAWPNQIFFASGAGILGKNIGSAFLLRKVREGADVEQIFSERDSASIYFRKTNTRGIALLKNLPWPDSDGVAVTHDRFEQPIDGLNRRAQTVTLKPGEMTRLTIKLQPKGTETIGNGK